MRTELKRDHKGLFPYNGVEKGVLGDISPIHDTNHII